MFGSLINLLVFVKESVRIRMSAEQLCHDIYSWNFIAQLSFAMLFTALILTHTETPFREMTF